LWATVRVAQRKANATWTTPRQQELLNIEFAKSSVEAWGRYEDHATGMENDFMLVAAMKAEVLGIFEAQEIEIGDAEKECGNGFHEEKEDEKE